jgi:thiaminase
VPSALPSDLPLRAPDLWAAATGSLFLDGVRDGTLPPPALAAWLAQDALFVADLLTFQARLVARAPRTDQLLLAGGVLAIVDELAWFDDLAARRSLELNPAPLPATLAYRDLLVRLDAAPYPDALAALWVIERVYLDAWTSALPAAPAYRELVEHWTTPAFAAYVAALEQLAQQPADTGLLGEVLRQEVAFWDAAFQAA